MLLWVKKNLERFLFSRSYWPPEVILYYYLEVCYERMEKVTEEFGAIIGNKNLKRILFLGSYWPPVTILYYYLEVGYERMEEVMDADLKFGLELLIDLYGVGRLATNRHFWSLRVIVLTAFFFMGELEKVDSILCTSAKE